MRDGAQVKGDVVPADKERLDAARRELFAYRQPIIVNDEPEPDQDDNATQDEYTTAESQVGGEEQNHQQHNDGQDDEEPNHNAGVHFWGDTESESEAEDDGFSCGLPEIDDWPNDHYTPCQEERLSNTVLHAMRFIMVKDDNNLDEIEEDTQERRRRRTVLDLAEANRVADLCNEIRRHAQAIRQERKLHEEIFSEVELRKETGRGNYPNIRDKAGHIRKSREIFNSNNFEDIRWRQKFCNAKDLSDFTRSRGTRTLTTPPPPQSPGPEENAAAHSSDSGTSFTVLESWNEEPKRPVNAVAPIQRQEDAGDKDEQEDAAPAIL